MKKTFTFSVCYIFLLYLSLQVGLAKPTRNLKLEAAIRKFYLQNHPHASDTGLLLRYYPTYIDINGDGRKESLVLIFGDCGAMACPLEIATPTKKGYRVLSELRPIRTPVWVSVKKSNGWHNIIVTLGGTAADKRFRSAYRFDGKSYVEDATDHGLRGKMIIPNNISPLNAIPLKIMAR